MIDCWPQTNSLRLIAHSFFSFVFIIFRHWLIVFLPVSLFRLQSGLSAGITETACTSVGKPDWQPEAPGPGVECHLLQLRGAARQGRWSPLGYFVATIPPVGVTGQHGQHRIPAVPIIISQVCLCLVVDIAKYESAWQCPYYLLWLSLQART